MMRSCYWSELSIFFSINKIISITAIKNENTIPLSKYCEHLGSSSFYIDYVDHVFPSTNYPV